MYIKLSLFVILLLLFTTTFAQYSPDGNTVLLMPFDGNLTDVSATGATAEALVRQSIWIIPVFFLIMLPCWWSMMAMKKKQILPTMPRP